MILKTLLIQGFKSFPDKTEIQFLGGLTAIVGPNGSGKSNISDAIRWVLGEQSTRSLRGAKMEDVIFGGTTKRGSVGFAEVSLILDNTGGVFRSEFAEIMITRRYYRSGESEYSLNKKNCRLKDIHELFMDTGLGRDGYSIIGQGRIDEILSLKSGDRREIFEEAAGITKFRYRKEEAERRLAATEENLERIRDIYTELENRKEPLEKQAEKAKQFLLLRDELRVLEISLWLFSLDHIHVNAEKNEADAAICVKQLEETKVCQASLYAKSGTLAEDIRQAEAEIERLRTKLREAEQRTADHVSRHAVFAANIENNMENIERARRESSRQSEQAQTLQEQIATRQARCTQLDIAQADLAKKRAACVESDALRMEAEGLGKALLDQQGERQRIANMRFRAELDRTAAESALGNMEDRRDTIVADISSAAARVSEEEARQSALEMELAQCVETLSGSKNKCTGVSMKVESRKAKVAALENEAHTLAAERTDCENRIQMLSEMQKEYDGFSRSVKIMMNRAAKGVHGPISMLIRVPDEYVLAIETALGASASNIVVDSAQVGRDAIEYLKRVDGGRATFLPLDVIRPNVLREQGLAQARGFCGRADELVSCNQQYQDVIANALGRIAIVEDLDAALAIAKAHGNRFRIVTLDGQIIQAGGAMTGGSSSKSTGVLVRANKLRDLTARKAKLEDKQAQAQQTLAAAKREFAALDFDLRAIEAERIRAQENQVRLHALVNQHSALLESIRGQHAALTLERDHVAQARQQYKATVQEQTSRMQEAEELLRAVDAEIQKIEQKRADLVARQQENTAKVAQLATAIAENRTEAAAERRALADLETFRKDMENTIFSNADAISEFEAEIARLKAELIHADAQKKADEALAGQLQAQIASGTKQRMQIEEDKTAVDKQAQELGESILGLERERVRFENKTMQIKNDETQILNKMWESYELTPTPARLVARRIENIEQTEQTASALKNRMRALGNVNLDAVDEYEKLIERYVFLGAQKEDLERAQQELYKLIEQLTVHMKEIFASEFAKLNTNFGETFREIFGGGHAELQLEDTSDILHCGIEIRVSPPGKTLKTLTLLSGGEKAFVAIALYFAILKVRPTPFCVLDEIEAALDDVNVVRFAKYLRRLSGETQFIVITHRRGTMEEADMLYGVTMQEQGVSKLLVLNLVEAEQRLGIQLK